MNRKNWCIPGAEFTAKNKCAGREDAKRKDVAVPTAAAVPTTHQQPFPPPQFLIKSPLPFPTTFPRASRVLYLVRLARSSKIFVSHQHNLINDDKFHAFNLMLIYLREIGKAVPSNLCKLFWSFVKEHNTAKIIKAALRVYGLYQFRPTLRFDIYLTRISYAPSSGISRETRANMMEQILEKGERHAPARPSGKCLANPVCIDQLSPVMFCLDAGEYELNPICIDIDFDADY